MQEKQAEWAWQWERYAPYEEFLFEDWLYPVKIKDFKGKTALDCGCGQGDYLLRLAPLVKKGVGVDFNTAYLSERRFKNYPNLSAVDADLATMDLKEKFDMVYCIGVLHHTEDPEKTFHNLVKHVKPGGKFMLWVYSHEGNFLNRTVLEWAKSLFFLRIPKPFLALFGHWLTMALYLPIYTIYKLPLRFLPFYDYFDNWRKMSYHRNYINVFDKLNAPTTHFIKESQLKKWFSPNDFKDIHISMYKGVSWRASGTKK